jgi:predicted MFS family arabinose efflux permease
VASFAAQAQVRVTDSLLPQIAADFGISVGSAAIVITAYMLAHGTSQLFIGPVGDRFGKYLTAALTCAFSTILVMLCGWTQSLTELALARLFAGAAAGWIVPLAMAYVGDVTPYDQRQTVLGRYISGVIAGLLFGQVAGGVLGDLFGWRNVFFILAGMLALATIGLLYELATNPRTRSPGNPDEKSRGLIADYKTVLTNPWARIVTMVALGEALFFWGAFPYVGADLHLRFGLSFSAVGLIVATFGIGGLIYTSTVRALVKALGQRGLTLGGAAIIALCFVAMAGGPPWWLTPLVVTVTGLGFYMFHNTLQTNATQMSPEARGTAVAIFSAALYLGQTAGVAAFAPIVDRFGVVPIYLLTAIALIALAWWFARKLRARQIATS